MEEHPNLEQGRTTAGTKACATNEATQSCWRRCSPPCSAASGGRVAVPISHRRNRRPPRSSTNGRPRWTTALGLLYDGSELVTARTAQRGSADPPAEGRIIRARTPGSGRKGMTLPRLDERWRSQHLAERRGQPVGGHAVGTLLVSKLTGREKAAAVIGQAGDVLRPASAAWCMIRWNSRPNRPRRRSRRSSRRPADHAGGRSRGSRPSPNNS